MCRPVLYVLVAEFVVLTTTGLYLLFSYEPTIGSQSIQLHDVIRDVHRVCAWISLVTAAILIAIAVAAAVFSLLERVGRPRLLELFVGTGLVALIVNDRQSGPRLRWDQLALRAVTTSPDIRGYRFLWQGGVLSVIGPEHTVGALRHEMLWHTLVAVPSAALLVLGWMLIPRRLGHPKAERAAEAQLPADDAPSPYLS